jgi:hypothetical protein
MSVLSLFGLIAVAVMVIFYALEEKSYWFILAFSFSCFLGSIYGFLQGAWPFGLVEVVWGGIAIRKWLLKMLNKSSMLKNSKHPLK